MAVLGRSRSRIGEGEAAVALPFPLAFDGDGRVACLPRLYVEEAFSFPSCS